MIHVFIVNSRAGDGFFSEELRNKLDSRKDFSYYIVHTRAGHAEADTVRHILTLFEGEKIRIYSCGGSGTFCNILNGIPNPENVELAFYAKGQTNDFLKAFGDDRDKFSDIDSLIDGTAHMIDYIRTEHGCALNTCSIGSDYIQVVKTRQYKALRAFGVHAPYICAMAYALFFSRNQSYEISVDGKKYNDKFIEILFGNGGVIGGTFCFDKDINYTDGKGKLDIIIRGGLIRKIKTFILLNFGCSDVVDKTNISTYTSGFRIRRTDGAAFGVNFDGEEQPPQKEWNVEIVNKGLNFVIPKGVTIDE